MPQRRTAAAVLAVLPWLIFMSAEEGSRVSATMDFLGKLVNFLILFGGLAFVLRKPLAAMLRQKAAEVAETLRRTEASRAEAERKREGSRGRLAGLGEEIRHIQDGAEAESRAEMERIARLAAEESQRIRRLTEQELEEQVRAGLQELKAHAAERATALARERIRRRLTPDLQSALIEKSIEKLRVLHEESGPR